MASTLHLGRSHIKGVTFFAVCGAWLERKKICSVKRSSNHEILRKRSNSQIDTLSCVTTYACPNVRQPLRCGHAALYETN